MQNVPKILAMVLNNENQYTTSEKSAKYTPIERKECSIITVEEERLMQNDKCRSLSLFGKKIRR